MASSEISSVTAPAPQVQQPRQSIQPEAAKKDISEAERERQLRAQQQAQLQAQERKPVTNTQGQTTGTIINTTA
jgi:hypothetical protein